MDTKNYQDVRRLSMEYPDCPTRTALENYAQMLEDKALPEVLAHRIADMVDVDKETRTNLEIAIGIGFSRMPPGWLRHQLVGTEILEMDWAEPIDGEGEQI